MKLVKEFIPYVIIIVVVILIRTFIVTPVQVDGHSMDPTLKDHQILILNKWKKDYNRFDIVVIDDGEERLIKRIIGLPGETLEIKNNKLYINGKYIKENFEHDKTDDFIYHNGEKIPNGYYFVMGDNRDNSKDSRFEEMNLEGHGAFSKKQILGVTNFSVFPFQTFGQIEA